MSGEGVIPDETYVIAPDATITVAPEAPLWLVHDDGTRTQIGTIADVNRQLDGLHVEFDTTPLVPHYERSFSFDVPHEAWGFWARALGLPLRLLAGSVPYKPSKHRYGR